MLYRYSFSLCSCLVRNLRTDIQYIRCNLIILMARVEMPTVKKITNEYVHRKPVLTACLATIACH